VLAAFNERVLRRLAEEPAANNPLPAADPRRARLLDGPGWFRGGRLADVDQDKEPCSDSDQ
jgi:hypothetical protein